MLGEFAARLAGSPDLYQDDNRRPTASINFITAHDGFTLYDLVSYNEKHNEANGEDNRDGESHNRSWNCGVEGPTEEKEVLNLRKRQQRNFLTTLFLSQGIPMLVAGDEISRTQQGNNNAYCQDNEISWVNWARADKELLKFTQELIALRKAHPTFCRRKWFQGQPIRGVGVEDIAWFLPDGSEMSEEHWNTSFAKSLGVYLHGKGIHTLSAKGEQVVDDSFYIIFNAHHEPLEYVLPPAKYGEHWNQALNTATDVVTGNETYKPGDQLTVEARSIILLQNPKA